MYKEFNHSRSSTIDTKSRISGITLLTGPSSQLDDCEIAVAVITDVFGLVFDDDIVVVIDDGEGFANEFDNSVLSIRLLNGLVDADVDDDPEMGVDPDVEVELCQIRCWWLTDEAAVFDEFVFAEEEDELCIVYTFDLWWFDMLLFGKFCIEEDWWWWTWLPLPKQKSIKLHNLPTRTTLYRMATWVGKQTLYKHGRRQTKIKGRATF